MPPFVGLTKRLSGSCFERLYYITGIYCYHSKEYHRWCVTAKHVQVEYQSCSDGRRINHWINHGAVIKTRGYLVLQENIASHQKNSQFHGMIGNTCHCWHIFVHSICWRCWPRSRNNTWWTKSVRLAMEPVEISVLCGFFLHSNNPFGFMEFFHLLELMEDFLYLPFGVPCFVLDLS